jgi:predicted Zn-dependent protease
VAHAATLEQALRTRGLVFEEPALQRHLDGVTTRIVPGDATAHVRFHTLVIRSPDTNAYALPNGALCVDVGLLADLEDEAQLAHVLAHEVSHVVARHALTAARDRASKRVVAKLAGIVLAPTVFADPAIGSLYAASVAGYGREQEEAADRDGLHLVAAAGYPLASVPRLFALLESSGAGAPRGGSPYRDHPSAEARARHTRELIAAGVPGARAGDAGAERYRRVTRTVLLEALRLHLAAGELRETLDVASRALVHEPDRAALHLYAGEAHRRLASDVTLGQVTDAARHARELASAVAAYHQALALDPALAEAHRGLGLVAIEQGDAAGARRELGTYLASGPVIDRRFIESLRRELSP